LVHHSVKGQRREGHGGGDASPPSAIETAIRDLVADQIKVSTAPGAAPAVSVPAKPRDALWLLLALTDLALLVLMIPADVLKDSRLDLFVKLTPWLATSLFALGAAWFKDWLVAFSRSPRLHKVVGWSFAILVAVRLPIMPMMPVRPVEPAATIVKIDGDSDHQHWFTLGPHEVEVLPKVPGCGASRTATLPPFRTALAPFWPKLMSLRYEVDVKVALTPTPVVLTINRNRSSSELSLADADVTVGARDQVAVVGQTSDQFVAATSTSIVIPVLLPAGEYQFVVTSSADGKRCGSVERQALNASVCARAADAYPVELSLRCSP
jgi:hypothetical protein